MSEMIERIAKAMCNGGSMIWWEEFPASRGPDSTEHNPVNRARNDWWRDRARDALAAMRIPTEEMIDGADDAFHEALRKHGEYNERAGISPGSFASSPFSEAIWPAMVDSALSQANSTTTNSQVGTPVFISYRDFEAMPRDNSINSHSLPTSSVAADKPADGSKPLASAGANSQEQKP